MGQSSGGWVIDPNSTWRYVEYATEIVLCNKSPVIKPDADDVKGMVIAGVA
jgi:hypothetical protein